MCAAAAGCLLLSARRLVDTLRLRGVNLAHCSVEDSLLQAFQGHRTSLCGCTLSGSAGALAFLTPLRTAAWVCDPLHPADAPVDIDAARAAAVRRLLHCSVRVPAATAGLAVLRSAEAAAPALLLQY